MIVFLQAWAQEGAGRNPNAPAETAQLDWMIGEWDLVSKNKMQDGSYFTHKATSTVYYVLDGYAIMDDFRALDDKGNATFRGTSFRTFDPRAKKWSIKWVMAGEPGMTDIVAEMKDGKLVMEGKGYDGYGKFLERAEYYDLSDDHYSFRLARSYDGGTTWIEDLNLIEATKKK